MEDKRGKEGKTGKMREKADKKRGREVEDGGR